MSTCVDRDGEMDAELASLREEREQILAQTHPALANELARLKSVRDTRLRVARDARALRLADARARSVAEARIARSEYAAAKAALRAQMLTIRRSVAKRRRGGSHKSAAPPQSTQKQMSFVRALESEGMLRLALAPDDVNADLAALKRGGADDTPYVAAAGERVHTARGILHFHDDVFEKGDVVAVYSNKTGSLPKFHGLILSINRKEMSIRLSETQTTKLYVSQLKSGRFTIKRDRDGHSLRNKKLST